MKKYTQRLVFIGIAVVMLVLYTWLIASGAVSFVDNTLQDQLAQEA